MICGRKGYPLKVVMPDNVTPERTQLLQMYGAEIVYSEGSKGSNGAVELALEMAAADSSYYMPYQYGNEANPLAHYNGTALEILEELDEVAAFVAGLGTGGTLMGNGRRLKETFGDAVKIVAAEPMQGEPVQGLRSLDDGFIPPIIDLSLLDRKIFVTNRDAILWTRKLLDEEGIFAGVSTGRDRPRRGAHRRRARRGQRRLHRRRRRLEVPLERALHAAASTRSRTSSHALVVSDPAVAASSPACAVRVPAMRIGRALYRGDRRARAGEAPNECCGMVASGDGAAVRVFRADERRTRARCATRSTGSSSCASRTRSRTPGWDLGAIYHSHTRSAPYPSQTDINLAF